MNRHSPKGVLRDPDYLKWLRDQPCLFTGIRAHDMESVVAAHIGTLGRGIKSPDNEVIPVLDWVHSLMHTHGEIGVLRDFPDDVIRAAFRAYARELYAEYLKEVNK